MGKCYNGANVLGGEAVKLAAMIMNCVAAVAAVVGASLSIAAYVIDRKACK